METPCTFNIYRTWNPTNVEEASSMIYLPYDGCWILYNCMELCALIKELSNCIYYLIVNCLGWIK